MKNISDEELLNELKIRFKENRILLKELKEVNKKLEESEKLKSDFLSNIRNEINNPFAAILGLSQNILSMNEADPEGRIKNMASMIYNEAFKLDFQLRNIFAAAEIEAGEVLPEVSSVNIYNLISTVIEKFQHKASGKGIAISFRPALREENKTSSLLKFCTDPGLAALILANLVDNAIAFSAEGNMVNIAVHGIDQGLTITVQDKGIGIDPNDQDRVFDRFMQLDQGATKVYQGHGLGLSVARSIAEILNGSLRLDSSQGAGSTFTLYLPEGNLSLKEDSMDINEDGIFL